MLAPDWRLSRLHVTTERDDVVMRLGDGFLEPCHLVGAAAAADLHRERLTVVGPTDPNTARYASRMHLGQVFDELQVTHDLGHVRETDQRANLFEVVRLEIAVDVRRWAELVVARVASFDVEAAHLLWESITEIGLNVGDHADAAGYAAAQPCRQRVRCCSPSPTVAADCSRPCGCAAPWTIGRPSTSL